VTNGAVSWSEEEVLALLDDMKITLKQMDLRRFGLPPDSEFAPP
jgi:pyruvate-formate lyase-activating enzyme